MLFYILFFLLQFLGSRASEKDYYQILGVSQDAQTNDIKKAYKKLALKYHPDKNSTTQATEKFKEIGEAHEILSDPETRKKYDTEGFKGVSRVVEDISFFFGNQIRAKYQIIRIFNNIFWRKFLSLDPERFPLNNPSFIVHRFFVNDEQHNEDVQKDMADRLSRSIEEEIKKKRETAINISTNDNQPIDILTSFSFKLNRDLSENDLNLLHDTSLIISLYPLSIFYFNNKVLTYALVGDFQEMYAPIYEYKQELGEMHFCEYNIDKKKSDIVRNVLLVARKSNYPIKHLLSDTETEQNTNNFQSPTFFFDQLKNNNIQAFYETVKDFIKKNGNFEKPMPKPSIIARVFSQLQRKEKLSIISMIGVIAFAIFINWKKIIKFSKKIRGHIPWKKQSTE